MVSYNATYFCLHPTQCMSDFIHIYIYLFIYSIYIIYINTTSDETERENSFHNDDNQELSFYQKGGRYNYTRIK